MNDFSKPALDLNKIASLQEKPPLFSRGDANIWTDPHIARQMLAAHLNPNNDAASRRPETIDRSVEWIVQTLGLRLGESLLDLGCGPGLYALRLAQRGLQVIGIDFSSNSIHYALEVAHQLGLEVEFRCQDYLQLEDQSRYDAVLLIYGDLCPLSPEQRARLLTNVHRALKPGGHFVLDVTTPILRQREGLKNGWYASAGGFWKPGLHLVLEAGFAYEGDVYLDQYIIIEENGSITVIRNWFQDYTAETIRAELEANGFAVASLWSDLVGTSYQPDSDWIGVVARKK